NASSLDQRRLPLHRDRFLDAPELESRVDGGAPIDLQDDPGLHERAEARQREFELIWADRKTRDGVTACLVRDDRPGEAGVGLRRRHRHAWQEAAARVAN